MAQGGTFCVSTGRALPSFAALKDGIPMNGPTVLFNGAAIYDFAAGRYLCTAFLPECIRDHVRQLSAEMPDLTFEIYHDDNSIHVVHPNEITARHLHLTHSPSVADRQSGPGSVTYLQAAVRGGAPRLRQLEKYIRAQPWSREYEVVATAVHAAGDHRPGRQQGRHGPPSGAAAGRSGRRTSAAWGTTPTTSPCWNMPVWPSPRKTPLRRCTGCRGPHPAGLPGKRHCRHDRNSGPALFIKEKSPWKTP